MANGFKALRHVGGGVQRYSAYGIAATDIAPIFNGDMVKEVGGDVSLAATNEIMVGTFVGVMYVDNKGAQIFSPYWPGAAAAPGATKIEALVSADPKVTYAVEDASGILAAGSLCDLVYAPGSTVNGQSAAQVGASVNGDFKVRGVRDASLNLVEVEIV